MTLLKLRESEIHWREIDGEIVALETRGSRYVAANGSGTVLWHALLDGATREDLAGELVRVYGIDRSRALIDVDRFVAALAEQDLLAA